MENEAAERILLKLDLLDTKIGTMDAKVGTLQGEVLEMKGKVDTIESRLFRGSGRPSIQEEQAAQREKLESLSKSIYAIKKEVIPGEEKQPHWLVKGFVAIVVAALGSTGLWAAAEDHQRARQQKAIPAQEKTAKPRQQTHGAPAE